MDERGEISPTDISRLISALESQTISLHGVAEKVKDAFPRSSSIDSPTTLTHGVHGNISVLTLKCYKYYRQRLYKTSQLTRVNYVTSVTLPYEVLEAII